MGNFNSRSANGDEKFKNFTQNAPVKITKGSLKNCQGKISASTSDGVYFIRIDKCQRETDRLRHAIDLFLPGEFELLD